MIRLAADKSFCKSLPRIEQNFNQPLGQLVTWCYKAKLVEPEVIDSTETRALLGLVSGTYSDLFDAKRVAEILYIEAYCCEEGHMAAYRFHLRLGKSCEERLPVKAGYLVTVEDWELCQ